MADVVIVGGGMAGLATAYELHKQGVSFVVLEAGSRAGGVVLSEQVDGFTLDAGPDSLLVQKPDGIKLCEELGLGGRLVSTKPPRLAFIQRAGRLHALPAASVLGIPTKVGPFLGTRLFSWAGKLRMAAETLVPRRADGGDESIGAFIRRRFGNEAVDYLAEPLLAGIHAGDVERLSIQTLFPRFAETERKSGSLLLAFRRQAARAGGHGASADGAFRSLPGGLSEMVDALVKALPADSIKLNTGVRQVSAPAPHEGGDGRFTVETKDGAQYTPRAVVLATPAFVTGDVIATLDADLAAACRAIPYASTATVALAFRREAVRHPLNGSGFVVPKVERTGILAASWLSSKWPHRAPEGTVLMRAFFGGARDPEALASTDAQLVDRALGALRPLLGIDGAPILTRVYRWARANAQHEVGHLDHLRGIEHALARHPGLYITGSGFRGVGIPDCVADGRATARQVTAWLTPASTS